MKAIIFDFGNVVGFFDHRRAARRLAEYGGLDPEAVYRLVFGGALEDDYESGRFTTAEYLQRLRKLCNVHCSDADLNLACADIFWPNDDVCGLLPHLKGRYRLILGSNTNELHATHFLKQFAAPLGYFDALVMSHQIGVRKPRREFFEHCLRLAECAPSECVFIDDIATNVAGARECGLHGIVYTDIGDLQRCLIDLGIEAADGSR
jgi:glucose-1-phosphatase